MRYLIYIAISLFLVGCGILNNTTVVQDNRTTDVNNSIDVNTTVDINNTTVVIINNNKTYRVIDGDGSFDDPYELKQARYGRLNGKQWFITPYIAYMNCSINLYAESGMYELTPLNDSFIPLEYSCINYRRSCAIDANNTQWIMVRIGVLDVNGSIAVTGECLNKPIFNAKRFWE